MPKIEEIVLATTNSGKLLELRHMLAGQHIAVRGLADFEKIDSPPENGETFAENARQKALYYGKLLGSVVLADDSGLEVEAIHGAPGVRSARFAEYQGDDPKERDMANNAKLVALLADVPPEKRAARFCCSLCLCRGEDILLEVSGFVPGVIGTLPRGQNGFGYDPIFYLPERQKTIAELDREDKNAISHRGQALAKLLVWLNGHSG